MQKQTCLVPKLFDNNFCKNQVPQVGCHRDSDGSSTYAQEVHEATGPAQHEQTQSANAAAFGESSRALAFAK